MALFSALGSTDLHYENIIANNENPVFIDLETLLGNTTDGGVNSVLGTGLLPQPKSSNKIVDVDISGICGKKTTSMKMKNMVVCNPNMDDMYITEKEAEIKDKKNIAGYKKKSVDVSQYMDYVLSGFSKTADYIINDRNNLLSLLEGTISNDEEYRIVLRHTHVYAKYLSALSHPDYMTDHIRQRELLERLRINCDVEKDTPRIEMEINELGRGDVPCFGFRYDSRDLFSDGLVVAQNYFEDTAKDKIEKRFNTFRESIVQNKAIVKKTLLSTILRENSTSKSLYCANNEPEITEGMIQERIYAYGNGVAEEITCIDENTAILYINRILNNEVQFDICNLDLYEGGGLIIFLAALAEVTGNEKIRDLTKRLVFSMCAMFEYMMSKGETTANLSAFSGMGSAYYVLKVLASITNNMQYAEKAIEIEEKINPLMENYIITEHPADYLNGISGFIDAMISIIKKEKGYCGIDRSALYRLCVSLYSNIAVSDIAEAGLAHGLSGYAMAMMSIYELFQEKRFLDRGGHIIEIEDELMKNKRINGSWCKGIVGTCIARARYYDLTREYDIDKSIKALNSATYENENSCICHGTLGTAIATDYFERHGLIENKEACRIISMVENRALKSNRLDLGFNKLYTSDCFMTGASGVYYTMLRRRYKKLPNIQMLML